MAHSVDDVLVLAQTVVKPGGKAMLYGADQKPRTRDDGSVLWVPIGEAVESGSAFLVEPKASLLALDLDPDEVPKADYTLEWLDMHGFAYVLVASGREGHRHAWVNVGEHDRKRVGEYLTSETGIPADNVRITSGTRPPLSPHRHGYPVALISPATVAEALDVLGPAEVFAGRSRTLSVPIFDLLVNGGSADKGRHNIAYRVACGFVHAGFSVDEFTDLMLNPANVAGMKYREEMGHDMAVRDLGSTYDNAKRFVESNPVSSPREHAQSVRSAVEGHTWSGRTGASDRAVMLALTDKAYEVPTFAPALSVRDIADYGQLTTQTVKGALKRLTANGWLEKERGAERWHATAYRLRKRSSVPVTSPLSILSPLGVSGLVSGTHPLFRNGTGLGQRSLEIYQTLDLSVPSTVKELLGRVGASASAVYVILPRLESFGLAAKTAGGWLRVDRSEDEMDELASEIGARFAADRQAERHAQERAVFARHPAGPPVSV